MKSFRQQVLAAVLEGASTISQVLARVGNNIPASQAAAAGRREQKWNRKRNSGGHVKDPRRLAVRGKRMLVANELQRLCREGKVRRVGVGAYAPPLPKLHHPQAG